MGLTQVVTASAGGTTATPDKTIAVQMYSANTLMYTVPDGRRFEGYLYINQSDYLNIVTSGNTYSTGSGQINSNISTQAMWPPNTSAVNSASGSQVPKVELHAGDMIYSNAGSARGRVIGREFDA